MKYTLMHTANSRQCVCTPESVIYLLAQCSLVYVLFFARVFVPSITNYYYYKANQAGVRIPDDFQNFMGHFLVQGYICDDIFVKM